MTFAYIVEIYNFSNFVYTSKKSSYAPDAKEQL